MAKDCAKLDELGQEVADLPNATGVVDLCVPMGCADRMLGGTIDRHLK